MTILQALTILEAGILECKERNIDTREMREVLNFLEPHRRSVRDRHLPVCQPAREEANAMRLDQGRDEKLCVVKT
jgi:hypothetical protein